MMMYELYEIVYLLFQKYEWKLTVTYVFGNFDT